VTDKLRRVVLVVEQDKFLKSLTADIMEDAGFATLQASDADEAVAILASRSDIALLLTSVTMPGSMDGLGLAYMVRQRWPAIRIIITSSKVWLTANNFPIGSRFVPKPYRAQVMISEIRSLVGPQAEPAS
jgi:two-component system, response regulator PdtaR